MSPFGRLLAGWTAIAVRFGAIQTLVMLGLFYVTLVGPAAILSRLAGRDFLDKRGPSGGDSAWKESESAGADLERAGRMS